MEYNANLSANVVTEEYIYAQIESKEQKVGLIIAASKQMISWRHSPLSGGLLLQILSERSEFLLETLRQLWEIWSEPSKSLRWLREPLRETVR